MNDRGGAKMSDISKAREEVAQAWCMPTTSGIEMDIRLAEAFALILEEKNNQIVQAQVCGSCKRWDRADELCLAFDKHKSRKDTCDKWEEIK